MNKNAKVQVIWNILPKKHLLSDPGGDEQTDLAGSQRK
jgi:hypothetical protein